jgi:hypothetical protein
VRVALASWRTVGVRQEVSLSGLLLSSPSSSWNSAHGNFFYQLNN